MTNVAKSLALSDGTDVLALVCVCVCVCPLLSAQMHLLPLIMMDRLREERLAITGQIHVSHGISEVDNMKGLRPDAATEP